MADPTGITLPVGPVLNGVKWIADARKEHVETDGILQRALARALCEHAEDDDRTRAAALALRGRLYAAPDATQSTGKVKRGWARTKRVGRKLVHRVEREMIDGPRFEHELEEWVQRAVSSDDLSGARGQLPTGCKGAPVTVNELAEGFPRALVSVLTDMRPSTQVGWEMLQRLKASDETATWSAGYLTRGERVATATTASVGGIGAVVAVAEGAVNANDAVTGGASILVGLLAILTALLSGSHEQRDARRDPARRAARRYARAWAADYLSARTGERIASATATLRVGVAEAIGDGRPLPPIGELREDLATRIIPRARGAGEAILAEALEQVEDTLVRCCRAGRNDGTVEAALLEVIAAAAEPEDAGAGVLRRHRVDPPELPPAAVSVEQQQLHG